MKHRWRKEVNGGPRGALPRAVAVGVVHRRCMVPNVHGVARVNLMFG